MKLSHSDNFAKLIINSSHGNINTHNFLAFLVAYILFRPTSKKELKNLKTMTIGQIWDFKKKEKIMKKIFICF